MPARVLPSAAWSKNLDSLHKFVQLKQAMSRMEIFVLTGIGRFERADSPIEKYRPDNRVRAEPVYDAAPLFLMKGRDAVALACCE